MLKDQVPQMSRHCVISAPPPGHFLLRVSAPRGARQEGPLEELHSKGILFFPRLCKKSLEIFLSFSLFLLWNACFFVLLISPVCGLADNSKPADDSNGSNVFASQGIWDSVCHFVFLMPELVGGTTTMEWVAAGTLARQPAGQRNCPGKHVPALNICEEVSEEL